MDHTGKGPRTGPPATVGKLSPGPGGLLGAEGSGTHQVWGLERSGPAWSPGGFLDPLLPLLLTHFPDSGSQGGAEVQQRPLSHKVPPRTGHLRGQVTEQAPQGHVPTWVSHDPEMRRLSRGGEQARRGRERVLALGLP